MGVPVSQASRIRQVFVCMEVVGCPTICQHCRAQGVPYPAMPLADITYVLEQVTAYTSPRSRYAIAGSISRSMPPNARTA